MSFRFAFAGFRHGHILDLLKGIQESDETTVVAACEEDPETRDALAAAGDVRITHTNYDRMLAEVECDAVAVGDYYSKRGSLAIRAVEAGRHVMSDKPLCTSLKELQRIGELAAERHLCIGCQFDLRSDGSFIRLREILRGGELGEVHTFTITGQHPLLLGTRPPWYFEPGCHGGTLNDISIHAVDTVPWLSGLEIAEIVCARAWNAKAASVPHFKDSAQFMLKLDNGGGVIGDVSYLAPYGLGYQMPNYWRVTCHGSRGMAEGRYGSDEVLVATDADREMRFVPAASGPVRAYLHDFLRQTRGEEPGAALTTEQVLRASRIALLLQHAAEGNLHSVVC